MPPALPDHSDNAVKIQLRASKAVRDVIDRAAAETNATRTEFMLRAALNAAEDALLDRRLFELDDARMKKFEAALAAPIPDPARLKALLKKKPRWES